MAMGKSVISHDGVVGHGDGSGCGKRMSIISFESSESRVYEKLKLGTKRQVFCNSV